MEPSPEASASESAPASSAIRGMIVAFTVIRCVMYATPIFSGTPLIILSGLASLLFPAITLSQAVIAAVAFSWKVGATQEWREELFRGARRLGLIELVGLVFMLVGNLITINPPMEMRREMVAQFYLFVVTFLLVMLVGHFLPMMLQIGWLRSRGFEIVNVVQRQLPGEPLRWQFRIRDLMIITAIASLLLAPIPLLGISELDVFFFVSLAWRLAILTLGTLSITLALAAGAFWGSYNWVNQFQVAFVSWIVITVLEVGLCFYFVELGYWEINIVLSVLLVICNAIFVSILQGTWFYLEAKGWRLVLEPKE